MVRQDMKSLSKYDIGDCRTFTRYRTIDIDMKKDLVKILVDTVCPVEPFVLHNLQNQTKTRSILSPFEKVSL